MLATQYSIALPADYDMSVIRKRVAERGHALDRLPGLGLKAYLIEDRSAGGRRNQYAPFYLWTESRAASGFFWGGGGFGGIVRDFGRPSVATWLGAAFVQGPAFGARPCSAVLTRRALDAASDPADEAVGLRAWADEQSAIPDVHSVAALIDPVRWEAALFVLRTAVRPAEAEPGTSYEVLHLSAPGLEMLNGPESAGVV